MYEKIWIVANLATEHRASGRELMYRHALNFRTQ